jgi:mutator protein MutT
VTETNSKAKTLIGIAVVEHGDRYLVGTRSADGTLPGCAEFPGGKCHSGETSSLAAARECLEETGLKVQPVRQLVQRVVEYAHGVVDLHFWLCRPAQPEQVDSSHQGFEWVAADELAGLPFPVGNLPVIEMLTENVASRREACSDSSNGSSSDDAPNRSSALD